MLSDQLRPAAEYYVRKHSVSIGFADVTPGEARAANGGTGIPGNITGFLMSVRNEWFMITAGHVLEELNERRKEVRVYDHWELDDGGDPDHPIPFDLDGAPKFSLYDRQLGVDIACIHLRDMYRRLLEANDKVPISEDAWKQSIDAEFEAFWLLGIPNQTIEPERVDDQIHIYKSHFFIGLERIPTPEGYETEVTRFCAKIASDITTEDGQPLSIAGMSGGPIYAIRRDSEGRGRYWVIAVQSGWLEKAKIVFGCPLRTLGEWLSKLQLAHGG